MKLGEKRDIEPHDHWKFEKIEAEREAAEEKAEQEMLASMEEARREWPAEKARREREKEQDECDHDEHEHGYCIDCGKDIFDDLVGRAELLEDR